MLRFRVLGASFSRFWGLRFRDRVLRFRVLGASCFGLRFRNYRIRRPEKRVELMLGFCCNLITS